MADRFLVVCATAAEATHVPTDLPLVITGMGKTAAAVATARALAAYDDLAGLTVLNVGSAGALRSGLAGVHEPGIVLNHDHSADAIRALGHDPQDRIEVGESDVVLATGDVFVSDPAVRDALAERAHLVDMEGYAVSYAARAAGVPVRLIKHVSDASFEADVLKASQPVLVDYWAEWCGPCKMIAPILDELAETYKGRLQIVKLNVDENRDTPAKYGIRGIPTLMLFRDGNVAATKVGALAKAQLAAFLDANL